MKNKKRILISACSGLIGGNSGDEAILSSILNSIRNRFECQIKVLTFQKDYTSKFHGVQVVKHSLLDLSGKVKEAIKECDIFIMGGGTLLQDQTSVWSVMFWLKGLNQAADLGKKTYVYANGVGPIKSKINRVLVRNVLNKVDTITVRDADSRLLLEKIGVNRKIMVTADPVYSLQSESYRGMDDIIRPFKIKNKKFIMVSLRHWFDTHPLIPVKYCVKFNIRSRKNQKKLETFIKNLASTVDWINDELDMDVVFFSMLPRRDYKVAREILDIVKNKKRNILLNKALHPNKLIALISKSSLVIGMRLHSLIYSVVSNKTFVALSYSTKVDSLLKEVNLENVGIGVDDCRFYVLKNLIKKSLVDSIKIEKELSLYLERCRELDQRNLSLLNDLLLPKNNL